MKFSETWLREWVDPKLSRDELLAQLTMAGLEVDGVEPVGAEFTGVIVGRIESCIAHPDADKLSVCTVTDGKQEFQVVCGAPNARPGLLTAFARLGAVLPGNFKIKKAKLRGVESQGMLCSAAELGLGDDHDGIIELDADSVVGADCRQVLQLDDITVDLDLTPNRGDCLSLKGLAREVGVLNRLPVAYPEIVPVAPESAATFPVTLANPQGCPRYLGRVIEGVDLTRPTPRWMAERLRRCGLRSIDPIVDVTNYVLIELGQPMHAFDLQQISEQIVVRNARAGESLKLLDGQEVKLDDDTLLITDASGPVAIAGVMGGERSGVQKDTRNVFLECAFFAPLAIAGTARRYGLHTDASHRYERGVDFELQAQAMERATRLLIDIVGGRPGPVTESVSAPDLPQESIVSVRKARLDELLGVEIDAAQVDDAFARLDFEVITREGQAEHSTWQIRAPSHRYDIGLEADLVEEVCRIYGYNNIPSKRPITALELRRVPLEQRGESALKRFLAALGLQEVVTYSFIDPSMQDLLDPTVAPLTLANPMSSEQSVMRTSLLSGLIEAVAANRARQQTQARLFETGLTFVPGADGLAQQMFVAGVLWGRQSDESWHSTDANVDYFDVKGVVDSLLLWAGLAEATFEKVEDPVLHPGQSAGVVIGGQHVGRLGRIHPEIEAKLDLGGVYVFELQADAVLRHPRRRHTSISKFPSVRRDLAVLIDRSVTAADLESTVRQALGPNLVEFRLFDVYEGKGIDSTEKSVALGLTFQSQTATLTDEEIGQFADDALAALQTRFDARLR